MQTNRIRKYEKLWQSGQAAPSAVPTDIPEGFIAQSLSHLPKELQEQIAKQRELYLWAYLESKRRLDEQFFGDFMI